MNEQCCEIGNNCVPPCLQRDANRWRIGVAPTRTLSSASALQALKILQLQSISNNAPCCEIGNNFVPLQHDESRWNSGSRSIFQGMSMKNSTEQLEMWNAHIWLKILCENQCNWNLKDVNQKKSCHSVTLYDRVRHCTIGSLGRKISSSAWH